MFHYSSIGSINLLHYNTNLFLTKTIGKVEADKRLEPLMIVPHNKLQFVKNYKAVNKECRNAILENVIAYTFFHFKGILYFFIDPGRFDIYNFFRLEDSKVNGFLNSKANKNQIVYMWQNNPKSTLLLLFLLIVKVIKTIGFIGFLLNFKKSWSLLIVGSLVFYIAILTGPLGASRFALPVELIIISFAAVYYSNLIVKVKSEKIIQTTN